MNERIKELAEQADEFANNWFPPNTYNPKWQEVRDQKFAELIRADEREACAVIAENHDCPADDSPRCDFFIAKAIRVRGEVK